MDPLEPVKLVYVRPWHRNYLSGIWYIPSTACSPGGGDFFALYFIAMFIILTNITNPTNDLSLPCRLSG